MSVRLVLIVLNIVGFTALAAYLVWSVLSPRRARAEGERTPANRTPFLPDEDLEGRRLERVLGWSLLFAGVLAVSLPLYWLREPTRQSSSIHYFDEGAVERGRVLFAGPASEAYNSTRSQQCANCHGDAGGGGSARQVIDPDGEGPLQPQSFTWKAPALDTVLLRMSEDEVARVITYGRPGTPMQAFGVEGGGAESRQTIRDLVAFIGSIQLGDEEARAQATATLAAARQEAGQTLQQVQAAFATAEENIEAARTGAREALGLAAGADDDAITEACAALEARIDDDPDAVTPEQRSACRAFRTNQITFTQSEQALSWAQQWRDARTDASDGQLLFELYCARCHTQGWSVFDPADPTTRVLLGEPGGGGGLGGGIGFNLRDGATIRRFGEGEAGRQAQIDFVAEGSQQNQPYGRGGIGSGQMPGFGRMLTPEQVEAIVDYERDGLDDTTYPRPGTNGAEE